MLNFNANTLTTIGNDAFRNTFSLRSVVFPPTVNTIGNDAFRGSALTEALFLGRAPVSFGARVFDDLSANFSIFYNSATIQNPRTVHCWTTPTWNGYPARTGTSNMAHPGWFQGSDFRWFYRLDAHTGALARSGSHFTDVHPLGEGPHQWAGVNLFNADGSWHGFQEPMRYGWTPMLSGDSFQRLRWIYVLDPDTGEIARSGSHFTVAHPGSPGGNQWAGVNWFEADGSWHGFWGPLRQGWIPMLYGDRFERLEWIYMLNPWTRELARSGVFITTVHPFSGQWAGRNQFDANGVWTGFLGPA
jgi:hypothetical protein